MNQSKNNDGRRFLHNNQQHFAADDDRPPILERQTNDGSRGRIVEDVDGTFMDRTHHQEQPVHSMDGGDDPYLFEGYFYKTLVKKP